jgi:two-component system, OmpR family, response regulator
MTAATIVFAREDLSIPGAAETAGLSGVAAPDPESHFFNLLRQANPDVIVLDLGRLPSAGVPTILKIRQRSQIPILAVCDLRQPSAQEFRIAGAAECIQAPVDILALNAALQRIIKVAGRERRQRTDILEAFAFAGFTFYPHRDLLATANGASLGLTTSESRLLLHFVRHPWRLCPRAEIVGVLYDGDRAADDRAIDIVINRLRRKLVALRGTAAEGLIKTEFRRGYLLVAEVSAPGREAGAAA